MPKNASCLADRVSASLPTLELFALPPDYTSVQMSTSAFTQDWVFCAAHALLTLPLDDAINRILEHTARSVGADRGWMYEYDETGLLFRNTHEWNRENVTSHVNDLQYISVSMIAWLQAYLVDSKAIMINDVSGLPPVGRELRAELLRQGIQSTLTLPVFFEGRLYAGIGFDATEAPKHWGAEISAQLACCAHLIATARYGHRPMEIAAAAFEKNPVNPEPQIYLRTHGRVRGVTLLEITALRSARDYTTVYLHDGTEFIDLRPLSVWEGLLPTDRFMRIHRSCIVHLMHVHNLNRHAGDNQQRWEITIRGINTPWTVSRPFRRDLRYRLGV